MDEQLLHTADPAMESPVTQKEAVRYAPVSTGAFFGYKLLYGIPVIGWILCFVFSFTEKNVNKRNFARATLIGLILTFIITCAIGVAVIKVAEIVFEEMAIELLHGSFGELGPVKDALNELKDGKYDDLIVRIKTGEFGDHPELSGMLDSLRDGGVMDVMGQFQSGAFEDVMENFAEGKYDDLIQKAADGELGDLGALGDLLGQLKEGDMSGLPADLVP